jgi:hypothetical protein
MDLGGMIVVAMPARGSLRVQISNLVTYHEEEPISTKRAYGRHTGAGADSQHAKHIKRIQK